MARARKLLVGAAMLLPPVRHVREDLARVRRQRDDARRQLAEHLGHRGAEPPAARRSAAQDLTQPSFGASFYRMKRVRAIMHRELDHLDPVWRYNGKLEGRALAEEAGVPVPPLRGHFPDPASLHLDFDGPIVVKPTSGSTSRGVFPLEPRGTGTSYSVFHRREVTHRSLTEELAALVETGRIGREFMVEDLVPPPAGLQLPDDWKCYTIGGRVELVLQKRNHASTRTADASLRWYGRDGSDLGAVRGRGHDPALPMTPWFDQIVSSAERIAATVGSVFLRVDMLSGREGPVFGEVTPHPGGDQILRTDVDARLGAAMDRAEAVRVAATRGGY